MYSKACLECLKKECKYLLNGNIPSELLITRGESNLSFFLLFWKGSTGCAPGFSPRAHFPDVGGSECHWPEMVTHSSLHVEKMDN